MSSIKVKKAQFGYGSDFDENFATNVKEYPFFDKTDLVQKFFDEKFSGGENVVLNPSEKGFGLGKIDSAYTSKDEKSAKFLLSIYNEKKPNIVKTFILLKGFTQSSKTGIAVAQKGLDGNIFFKELEDPLIIKQPSEEKTKTNVDQFKNEFFWNCLQTDIYIYIIYLCKNISVK